MMFPEEMKNGKRSNQKLSIGSEEKFNQEYGNCLGGDTLISVFDKETGEYKEIPIKQLYKSI